MSRLLYYSMATRPLLPLAKQQAARSVEFIYSMYSVVELHRVRVLVRVPVPKYSLCVSLPPRCSQQCWERRMADQSVEDHLQAWGLEMYTQKFKEQNITLDVLLLISDEQIKELIPSVGHRVLLLNQLRVLKAVTNEDALNLITIPNDLSFLDASTSSHVFSITEEPKAPNPQSESSEAEVSLQSFLSSTNEGRALLIKYQNDGLLDNSGRRKLCNIIISNELKNDPDTKITSTRFYQLAYEITKVFPKESAPVYFSPYMNLSPARKIAAKGKLLDTYRQRRREHSKSGLIIPRKRTISSSSSCCSAPGSPAPRIEEATHKLPCPTVEAEESQAENLLWLQNSCDPWTTAKLYWTSTQKVRLERLVRSGTTIEDYFNEFRALRQSGGLYLLLEDFASLYPEEQDKLFNIWPLYRDKIIELARKRSDPALQKILSNLDENNVNDDTADTVAFMSLAFLMNTSTVRKQKIKKQWRPSKIESLESFITHIPTATDLEASLTLRREKFASLGHSVQPYIVIIGDTLNTIHTRYIVINNITYSPTKDVRYSSSSIIHAVDACFKIIFALNAEFPSESAHIWNFIQKALYRIKTKYDKNYTAVNSLMTDLNIALQ